MRSFYHYLLSLIGALIYRFPSRKIRVVGVTGTKGKSTTVELIAAIFEAAGKKVAVSSSRRMTVAGEEFQKRDTMTMPGRFTLQRFLRRAVQKSCDYAVIEVTSQGVVQHRHRFINFRTAVFLNIHPEHIEAHGSFEKYLAAKIAFFKYAARTGKNPVFFVSATDGRADNFLRAAAGHPVRRFSKETLLANALSGKKEEAGEWLAKADFLLDNAAAAAEVALGEGISKEIVQKALQDFRGVAGRLEYVQEKPFSVVIDYALTPDSLEGLYKNLTARKKRGRLIAVFGSAGGGRDIWKRKVLGEIADRYAERIILTSDDYYDEDPEKIMDDIASGVSVKAKISKITDRKEAIKTATKEARAGDIVAITGMGDQKWLHVEKGKMIPWDERGTIEEALK